MKNRITYFVVIYFFTLVPISFVQSQVDTIWTKTFGGSGSDDGYSVQHTTDGGYIITGITYSFGAGLSDVWLIKTDASGDTLWTKTIGGIWSDWGLSVQQTTDGGYIIVGYTNSFGAGNGNIWLIKTDTTGDTLWTKTFGGNDSESGHSVQQTTDGGYIITGYRDTYGISWLDVWLVKTDASGDTLWTKSFGGSSREVGNSVQQTIDGGYIITATTYSTGAGNGDIWLIKTDISGDTLWTKIFVGSKLDGGSSVRQTVDGGYIIVGGKESPAGIFNDVWLIKTDASGDIIWTKTYGGDFEDYGTSVQQTTDGGYAIVGNTDSFGSGGFDIWLLKTDALGDTLWTKTFGGSFYDYSESFQRSSDGGFILVGSTESFGAGGYDVWLIKTTPVLNNVEANRNNNINFSLHQNYPNPFNPKTKINFHIPEISFVKIKVYDVLGNEFETLINEEKPALMEPDYQVEYTFIK